MMTSDENSSPAICRELNTLRWWQPIWFRLIMTHSSAFDAGPCIQVARSRRAIEEQRTRHPSDYV
jgi:hypothetical protein